MPGVGVLDFRRIDASRDADLIVAHYLDAMSATFGHQRPFPGRDHHIRWVRSKIEEFPDGFVLAYLADECVGQLQLQVPYGLTTGYVNLFYVAPEFRRQGFGRRLHAYAERYFRSWEACRADLHVSPLNIPALKFYRSVGYRVLEKSALPNGLWKMGLDFH
jgi:ribosomal protein S18 acetylase RimI-like enzyme